MISHRHILIALALLAARDVVAADAKISFDSNVKVSVLGKNGLSDDQTVAAGKPVALKTDTVYWIAAGGRVPLLVVPQAPADVDTPVKLQMPNVADWPSDVAAAQLREKLTVVVDALYQFQSAIAKKDVTEAQKILDRMEATQTLDYFAFLHASLAFVKGDMAVAKAQVQRGLKHFPNNEQGLRLLKTIEGVSK